MDTKPNTFISSFDGEDVIMTVETVPEEAVKENYESDFEQELLDLEQRIEKDKEKIGKLDRKIDRLTNHADKVDYIVAASCGLLTGLIDAFFIGDAAQAQDLGKKPINEFVEHFARKQGYEGDNGLKGCIDFLEGKFKIPSDDIWKGAKIRVSASSHHLDDFAHHPTLIGLFCSILTQFTKVGYFQNRDGSLFKIAITEEGLIGETFWGKIGAGIIKWFGHLVSDVAGANSTAGAGMGIPGPFLSLAKELAALPGVKDSGLPNTLYHMFTDKNSHLTFDLRCEIGQSIPVLINICLVAVFYMIRRIVFAIRKYKAGEKVDIMEIIPSANRTYVRMLTIASGVFVATDMADAGIRSAINSGGNPAVAFASFVSRVNIVGVGQFAIALGRDLGMGLKKESARNKRMALYNELLALSDAKVAYEENGMWIEAKKTEKALVNLDAIAQESYKRMVDNWEEVRAGLASLSDKRDAIESHNPGLLGDMAAIMQKP